MERFGLTRLDLMLMTWSQVVMLFDSTYTEESKASPKKSGGIREATPDDYDRWA